MYAGTLLCDPQWCPDGFYCPNDLSFVGCFGKSGKRVLESLAVSYESIEADLSWPHELAWLLGIGTVLKMMHLVGFTLSCRAGKVPTANRPMLATTRPPLVRSAVSAFDEASTLRGEALQEHGTAHITSEHGATLEIVDCSYVVRGKAEKVLVDSFSARVSAGQVLALLGPSGAGKTTLLNMLTLQPGLGKAYGRVLLNGHALTRKLYEQHVSFVSQHESLWPFLTAREHVAYAVDMFQSTMGSSERASLVGELLSEMGLTSAQHTLAGLPPLLRGLSGGEQRRLSLAVALAKRPSLIFADEPTSGLDAAAAAFIMRFLKETAARMRLTIFCTIHQPSSAVFDGFDRVAFLTRGRSAYLGAASELPVYLSSIGRPLPPGSSPADFMLGLINKDFVAPATVDEMIEAWRARAVAPTPLPRTPLPEARRRSTCAELAALLHRSCALLLRDPTIYLVRVVLYLAASSIVALFYYRTRHLTQDTAIERIYFLDFLVAIPGLGGMIAVIGIGKDCTMIKREIMECMYKPASFLLVQMIVEIPMMALLAVASLVPSAYGIANFPWAGFAASWLVVLPTQWTLEAVAQLFSLTPNPVVGMMSFVGVWFIMYHLAGVAIKPSTSPQPIRALVNALPYRYSFATIAHEAYAHEPSISGTAQCDIGSGIATSGVDQNNNSLIGSHVQCLRSGFFCPHHHAAQCHGSNGADVLTSLQGTFEILSPDNEAISNASKCLAIALFFKATYLILFLVLARKRGSHAPPIVRPLHRDHEMIGPNRRKVIGQATHSPNDSVTV